jgi:hypothetical protein
MLVRCQECGHTVADSALACPHCGAPKPGSSAAHVAKLVFLFIVLIATVSAAGAMLPLKAEPIRSLATLLLLAAMLPALLAGFTLMFGGVQQAARYLLTGVGLAFAAALLATLA